MRLSSRNQTSSKSRAPHRGHEVSAKKLQDVPLVYSYGKTFRNLIVSKNVQQVCVLSGHGITARW